MNEIGIRIFWGPWEGDFNPAPIVSVGNVVGNIVPTVPALVIEEPSWMIKLDESKAVYSCFSKERCTHSENYMQMLVCVVIPKGLRLDRGKGPLDLLEEVRNQFDLLFSFDLEATLPSKEKVDMDFGRLLESYTLTACPWYVFNMEGSNPASFCVESRAQLDALMRFNAYKELAHVEHLELGFKCKTTVDVNTKGGTGSKPQKEENTTNVKDNKDQIEPNNNIALYIGGTRFRHGGFGYILSVGVLAGNESEGEIDMPPISIASTTENPVITLKNAENYVYYKLYDCSIAPSDDVNNSGRLAIGMTMPSNVRLKDGKSPYNLLMDIYQKFLELGTAQINGNQRVFLHVDLDKSDFVRIIEQYPFEKVPVKVEAMRGTTIAEICVPQEKMEDFFRDTQYPEFVNYKAVEVTTKGKNMFPDLSIPRPISYDVEKEDGNKDKDEENNNKSGKDNHRNVFILIGVIGLVVGVLVRIGYMKVVENKLIKQEEVCYNHAIISSDTLLMKIYLRDYSASQFKYPNKGHLTDIEEKLNLARMEAEAARKAAEAEAEAYSKCKDESKSLDERIKACEEYIKEEYKSKTEISKLKKDLETSKEAATNAEAEKKAFDVCKKAQGQPYPKNYEACQTYKRGGYSNEKNGKEVEGYIKKILDGRHDILVLLNAQKLNEFNARYGKNKWKQFITEAERNAFVLILKPNYGGPVRNSNVSNYIKDTYGFPDKKKFNNWDEVVRLKSEMDKIL